MKTSNVSTEQGLLTLFSSLVNLVDSHVSEASSDLRNTELILDDAIKRLIDSFYAIHREVEGRKDFETVDQHEILVRHLQEAIISLQFHDITTQLLQRITVRLNGLCNILLTVTEMSDIQSNTDNLITHLQEVDKTLMQLNNSLHNLFAQAPPQQNMTSGDIELF